MYIRHIQHCKKIVIMMYRWQWDFARQKQKKSKVHSYPAVLLLNNSGETIFAFYRRNDEDDTKKWEVRLFLEKDRGEVGRTSWVAPLVVIREEPSHRSPWALNRLPLAEGKKVGDIEKNGRDERKVWSGRGRSLSSRYPAHGSTFVFVILERKLESRNPSFSCALKHVREYFSSSSFILLFFAQKRDSILLT